MVVVGSKESRHNGVAHEVGRYAEGENPPRRTCFGGALLLPSHAIYIRGEQLMGKLKQVVMTVTEDDMGQPEADLSFIKEIQLFNDFMEGFDFPIVPEVEGYSNECNN